MRIRQAVLAARDLDSVVERLRSELGLGEPFADEGVGWFGLRNAVFALEDTFLEVVSPVKEGTAAGKFLDRRGGDCGYMVMLQIAELFAARERARAAGVREVFEVSLPDIDEVHLHPADMRGAIVSLSSPKPPGAWRWGGPAWESRSAPLRVSGMTVAVAEPGAVGSRWAELAGGVPTGLEFRSDPTEPGLVEIALSSSEAVADSRSLQFGSVRIVVHASL